METADAAYPNRVPELVELSLVGGCRWLHHQLLEAVLPAVLTSVRTRDPLGALLRDRLGQVVDS